MSTQYLILIRCVFVWLYHTTCVPLDLELELTGRAVCWVKGNSSLHDWEI